MIHRKQDNIYLFIFSSSEIVDTQLPYIKRYNLIHMFESLK